MEKGRLGIASNSQARVPKKNPLLHCLCIKGGVIKSSFIPFYREFIKICGNCIGPCISKDIYLVFTVFAKEKNVQPITSSVSMSTVRLKSAPAGWSSKRYGKTHTW